MQPASVLSKAEFLFKRLFHTDYQMTWLATLNMSKDAFDKFEPDIYLTTVFMDIIILKESGCPLTTLYRRSVFNSLESVHKMWSFYHSKRPFYMKDKES